MDSNGDGKSRTELRALGDFLRAKRRTVEPGHNGTSRARRRLVPGLSRDEAASMADIGTSWYARLEAGRVAKPTLSTIRAVSAALQLNDAEQRFVLNLAGLLPRASTEGPASGSLTPIVALIANRDPVSLSLWDRFLSPLAWNDVADAMYGFSEVQSELERHPIVRLANEQVIAFFGDRYEEYARNLVGMFRRAFTGGEPTAHAREVYALALMIPIFQKYWDQQVVSSGVTITEAAFVRHHWLVGDYRATSADLLMNDENVLLRIISPTDDESRAKFALLAARGTSSIPARL
jgi:hypothetical protein